MNFEWPYRDMKKVLKTPHRNLSGLETTGRNRTDRIHLFKLYTMNKAWVGYLAVGFLFLSGIFEWLGGYPKLGVFLMILSVASLILRIYLNKKLKGKDDDNR